MSNLCCCGHMERSHFAGGWCRICWCAIFETSEVENPGTPYPTRTKPRVAPMPLEDPTTMADVPAGFSMPRGDE